MLTRLVLLSALAVALAFTTVQEQKLIIVTVLDQAGAAVRGVTAGDLAVVEDGANREVVEVKPATDPMTIAILVDNAKPPMGKNAPTQELRILSRLLDRAISTVCMIDAAPYNRPELARGAAERPYRRGGSSVRSRSQQSR